MKKNNPNTLLIVLSVVNVFAIGIWTTMYLYSENIEAKMVKSMADLAVEEAKGEYLTGISGDLRTTEANRKLIESTFIKIGDESLFLENIERLATSTKVELKVFAFEKKEESLHLSMQTRGSFSRNYLFMSLLEKLPYELQINKVTLEKLENDGVNLWESHYDVSVMSYLEK
jgi:hypothetical protein